MFWFQKLETWSNIEVDQEAEPGGSPAVEHVRQIGMCAS